MPLYSGNIYIITGISYIIHIFGLTGTSILFLDFSFLFYTGSVCIAELLTDQCKTQLEKMTGQKQIIT
jgi:hypothetical protein